MSIIENHILSIVNNNDGISAFCDSIWDDDDFNEYLEEIDIDNNYTLNSYQYDYNICKWEIMAELNDEFAQEQFFNDVLRPLNEDLTDADKHIILKYLVTEAVKPYCDITIKNVLKDYVNDSWESLICSYVYLKVHNMIFNEEQWLQVSIINKIEDEVRNRLRERVIRTIAINKIKRNKIFNLGLGLKLSIKNCGVTVDA
jgi:hypothetical protein